MFLNNWADIWILLFGAVIIGAIITILPIILAFLKKVKLHKVAKWFEEADAFEEQKQRLIDHELRMLGTLVYWKNKAASHNRVHTARIIWSLISAVALPVIVQFYDKTNPWSIAFLTVLTVFSGFIVLLEHALKSASMCKGFRQCESDYYDLARALLDFPAQTSEGRKEQVNEFLQKVERIRKAGRKVETGSPPSGLNGS